MVKNSIYKSIINIGSIKLLSCDIFDTLVFRLINNPHQIFYKVGQKATKLNLLHNSITAEEFALLRIKAEQDARKFFIEVKGHSEISLQQIYEFLPEFIGNGAKPNFRSNDGVSVLLLKSRNS